MKKIATKLCALIACAAMLFVSSCGVNGNTAANAQDNDNSKLSQHAYGAPSTQTKQYSNETGANSANADAEAQGIEFSLNGNGTYSVSGYSGTSEALSIPASHNGKAVSGVRSAAITQTVKEIIINSPVTVELPDDTWLVHSVLLDGTERNSVVGEGIYYVENTATVVRYEPLPVEYPCSTFEDIEEVSSPFTDASVTVSYDSKISVSLGTGDDGNKYLIQQDADTSGGAYAWMRITPTQDFASDKAIVFEADIKHTSGASSQYALINFRNSSGANIAQMKFYGINASNGIYYNQTTGAYTTGALKYGLGVYNGWFRLRIVIDTDDTVSIYSNGNLHSSWTSAAGLHANLASLQFQATPNGSTTYTNCFDNIYLGPEMDPPPPPPLTEPGASEGLTPSSLGGFTEIKDISTNTAAIYKSVDMSTTASNSLTFTGTSGSADTPVFVVEADIRISQLDEPYRYDANNNPVYMADSTVAYSHITTFKGTNQRYRVRFGNKSISTGQHNGTTVGKSNVYSYGEWFTVRLSYYSADGVNFKVVGLIDGNIVINYEGTASGMSNSLGFNSVRFSSDTSFAGVYEVKNVSLAHVSLDGLYEGVDYDVHFSTDGGTEVPKQTVNHGGFASEPEAPTRPGYIFAGWDFDFSTPIVAETTINALWTPRTDIPYTVKYYTQNLSMDGYELYSTEALIGTMADEVSAQIISIPYFTYSSEESVSSGYITADGGLVLELYYTRNVYSVTVVNEYGFEVSGAGEYPYGTEATVSITVPDGYIYYGMYSGNTQLTSECTYSFIATEDVTVTLSFALATYKVTYYKEYADLSGYYVYETEIFEAPVGHFAVAEIRNIFGYRFISEISTVSGTLGGEELLEFNLYYEKLFAPKYDENADNSAWT